ncbi:hypothetical protein BTO25_02540 [Bacillus sp. MB366]|nr:hypothetical protein BTO25_02540 [Bacillus sp. MB366]
MAQGKGNSTSTNTSTNTSMSTDISNSTNSSEARGKDRAWHTTRGEEQTNETTMKEQRKKNKIRTTKTNDNSKISEVNGSNEPCRGLAKPIIFLYIDIRRYPIGRHYGYIGCLLGELNMPCFRNVVTILWNSEIRNSASITFF